MRKRLLPISAAARPREPKKEEDPPKRLSSRAFDFITGFAGTATAILGIYYGFLDSDIRNKAQARLDQEAAAKLNLEVFKEVQAVLKDAPENAKRVAATGVLVEQLTTDPFRRGLLNALAQVAPEPAKAAVQQNIENAQRASVYDAALREQPSLPKDQRTELKTALKNNEVKWLNWDVDLFWCEKTPENKARAETARDSLLKLDSQAKGRWRVRALTPERNAVFSAPVQNNQVRYDGNDEAERALAEQLANRLNPLSGGHPFELKQTSQGTKWYVSVFFCAGAGAPAAAK